MGTNLRKLQGEIEALADEYIERLDNLYFVKDLTIWYPLRVIMTILGIPKEDEPLMSSPRKSYSEAPTPI